MPYPSRDQAEELFQTQWTEHLGPSVGLPPHTEVLIVAFFRRDGLRVAVPVTEAALREIPDEIGTQLSLLAQFRRDDKARETEAGAE